MNTADIIIILLFALGGVVGFKKGFITKLTSFVGVFLIFILAFYLKNPLSVLMYENLPFFHFGGLIKGIGAINILLYELLAFIIVVIVLVFVLKVILLLTGLVEKLLKMTLFLSLPSKILGAFVGVLETYIYIFIGLVILTLPVFQLDILNGSKMTKMVLNKTPILSPISSKLIDTYSNVYEIIDNEENKTSEQLNEEILILLLDNEIITKKSAENLIERNKIEVNNKDIVDNYTDKDLKETFENIINK